MVNSITNPSITQQVNNPPKVTKTSIFYVNDIHSNLSNIERLKSASDVFDKEGASQQIDKLKFSAGDVGVGRDAKFSKVGVLFQNLTGVMASAAGNHEFDLNKKDLVEVLKDVKYKLLGMNVEIPETTDLNKQLRKNIVNSYVQEQNGTKYGVIGLLPDDFALHLSDPDHYKDLKVMTLPETIPALQKEVDKLNAAGVNKIILLSHEGYSSDVELAKAVEGIDVIIGGHTHDLIKGIEEGKNLFYSKKTGAPTLITQAGKNGDNFGVLNLEFNENGVIMSAQNNINKSFNFPRSPVMRYFTDKILGKPVVLGTVKTSPIYTHSLITESPSANFLADLERKELGVDLAMINSGNIRANIEEGALTDRDLKMVTPFDNKVWVIKLSEKELIEAIKIGSSSMTSVDNTPGLLQFSGLKYTISKTGEIKEVLFVDKEGKEIAIDFKNPNPFKTYTVAVDDFIAKGGNGYLSGDLNAVVNKFDFDKNKLVEDYLAKNPAPVELSDEKRIKFVD